MTKFEGLRLKHPQEIKAELENIIELDIALENLKAARNITKELLIIERGRKIDKNLQEAIELIEDVREWLENYQIMTEITKHPTPVA